MVPTASKVRIKCTWEESKVKGENKGLREKIKGKHAKEEKRLKGK